MKKVYFLVLVLFINYAQGQYMSRCQPVPSFSCPVLCPGSTLELEIFQVQNLNNGDTVQALLSNANGQFTSGTTTLPCNQYSLNQGTSWVSGPFIYSSNVNNLYFEITIPNNIPVGTNYTILMKTSSGYMETDPFQCSGTPSDYISITAAYPVLAPTTLSAAGNDQWIGHVYTWTSTVPQSTLLTTDALINEQDFFDSLNYQGDFLFDSLSFNINYETGSGGTCPGAPGTLNNGTSIPCSKGFDQLFSIRMLRTENFPSGTYQLSIQADDGIRLSIDGGNTWLLNTFFEETYDTSYRSTAKQYPNGICLSGPTNLVIEYFQRYVQSQFTFKDSLISTTSVGDAGNQTGCAGSNVAFQLSGSSNSLTYEWYYSTNGGTSFVPVPNSAPFSGVNTSTLDITSVPSGYNNYLFQCQVSGLCGNPVNTAVDTLFVTGNGSAGNLTAGNQTGCAGSDITFQLNSNSNSLTYEWYYSTNGGTTFIPVPNNAPFSGTSSSALSITSLPSGYNNYLFRCQVGGLCGGSVNSSVDTLFVGGAGAPVSITATPNPICPSDSANICVQGSCNSCSYSWNSGNTTQCFYTNLAGDYYVSVTYGTGCTGVSSHLALNVLPSPSVSITVQGDTLTDLSGVSQQWYKGNMLIPGATSKVYIAPGPGNYSVLITDNNNCQELSNAVLISTGLGEINAPVDFTLYPNPVGEKGQILIRTLPVSTGKSLKVFDVSGQLILQTKIKWPQTELDLSQLASGVYFVELQGITKKVVKE